MCGVPDSHRQELIGELQAHLCNDTARMVYEYSVCDKPCGLRGRAGGKQCCSCRDVRPFNPSTMEVVTRVYMDGQGFVMQKAPRSKWYCPLCRAPPTEPTAEQPTEQSTGATEEEQLGRQEALQQAAEEARERAQEQAEMQALAQQA